MNANQGLVLLGTLALASAGAIWFLRQHAAPSPGDTRIAVPAAPAPVSQRADDTLHIPPAARRPVHDHEHSSETAGPTTLASTLPLPPALPLTPATGPADASPIAWLSGRADALRLQLVQGGTAVVVPALPTQGRVELVVASTLGGVEAERRAQAHWTIAADGIVVSSLHLGGSSGTGSVRAVCERGVWRCVDATDAATAQVAIECGRTVELLRTAFPQSKSLTPGQDTRIGGESFRVVCADPALILLAATTLGSGASAFTTDVDGAQHYPAGNGAWNDVAIWLDAGQMRAAERLVAAPSSVEEPGWYVRRLILRW